MNQFPINYILNSLSPTKMFSKRNQYKVWQEIFIFIFLVSLMMLPISFLQVSQRNVDLSLYVPKALLLLDDEIVNSLSNFEERYEIQTDETYVYAGNEHTLKEFDFKNMSQTMVVLHPDYFVLKDTGRPPLIHEGQWLTDQPIQNLDELKSVLAKTWFDTNHVAIHLTNFINISLLVMTAMLIIWLGSSALMSLMRMQRQFDIDNFKQARGLVLNALGLATVLATIFGLINKNVINQLTMQSLFLVIFLVSSFWFTHFNDLYVIEKAQKEGKN